MEHNIREVRVVQYTTQRQLSARIADWAVQCRRGLYHIALAWEKLKMLTSGFY